MWNIVFIITGIIFLFLLIFIFFPKPIIKSQENRLFKTLVLINLIGYFFEFFMQIIVRSSGTIDLYIIDVLSKSYLVSIFLADTIFSIYTFFLCFDKFKEDKSYKLLNQIHMLLFIIVSILIFVFKIEKFYDGDRMYVFGTSVEILKNSVSIYMMIWIIILLINFKKIKSKKFLPVFLILALLLFNVIVQTIDPGILITSMIFTIICYTMYFTIENPDVKMLKQVEMAKEAAEKANQAKTDFLSSMSHEIRTPLNAIVGFSESLKEENLTPTQLEEVNDIINASQTLLETVNGILDISKIEANKIEIIESTYDFRKIFQELVSLSKARLGEDKPIEFRYTIADDVPQYLYGDYARIKQIVINFLTNAIKYTKEGYIDFNVRCINNKGICRLIMTVEDSGIGIKKENINKLFNKFERGENENSTIEGTGLGLAITKKLVEMMHGKIIVQSIYGKGSQFMVIIDQKIIDQGNVVIQNSTENLNITHDLSNKKILIVDDNKLNIKVAVRLLKQYNLQITEALSGFECLDLIGGGNEYDLILLDDMMPKKNGKETFNELKSDPSFNTPVVILTANAITGMKEEYMSLGFNDYLAKPIEKDELQRVIKKYLDN